MKICYVLTGGSLRGIVSQTAALQVLEYENYIKREDVCGVVGTSAGSLTGAFYASGMNPIAMSEFFATMKKRDYVDPNWFKIAGSLLTLGRGMTGFLEGKRLLQTLQKNLPVKNIEDTKIPLAINVTNISKQVPEVLTRGDLATAVRASTSIPFIFKPQMIGESYYVDGGAVNNIPLDEAAKLFPQADAFVVITAMTIKNTEDRVNNDWIRKPLAPLFVLSRTLHAISRELYKDNLNTNGRPVAIIQIDPGPIDLQEIEKFREAYDRGLNDAYKKVPMALKEIGIE